MTRQEDTIVLLDRFEEAANSALDSGCSGEHDKLASCLKDYSEFRLKTKVESAKEKKWRFNSPATYSVLANVTFYLVLINFGYWLGKKSSVPAVSEWVLLLGIVAYFWIDWVAKRATKEEAI